MDMPMDPEARLVFLNQLLDSGTADGDGPWLARHPDDAKVGILLLRRVKPGVVRWHVHVPDAALNIGELFDSASQTAFDLLLGELSVESAMAWGWNRRTQ